MPVEHYRSGSLMGRSHDVAVIFSGRHPERCCTEAGMTETAPSIAGSDLDIPGLDQAGFPTVVKVAGRLANPYDDWYLWCAPHDNPGGIFLFSAPEPAGPWTARGEVLPTPEPNRHVSSPYVLWDGQQLVMWCHMLGEAPTDTQQTYRATSNNGTSWTLGPDPVIPLGTDPQIDTFNAAYLNVVIWNGTYYGYYQGSTSTSASHIIEVTSADGIAWTKTAQVSDNSAWVNEPGWSHQKPHPVVMNGEIMVAYTVRPNLTDAHNDYRVRAANGSFSTAYPTAIQPRPGEWDGGKVEFGDVVYHDERFWTFYSANPGLVSDGDKIGVRSIRQSQQGFDTSYGKG